MPRITSQRVRQAILTTDSEVDPDLPPEALALFDADGNVLNLLTEEDLPEPPAGLPQSGSTGQVLGKVSNDDFDAAWVDLPEGGAGVLQAWRGVWSYPSAYQEGDLVRFGNGFYMANTDIAAEGFSPSPYDEEESPWTRLAAGRGEVPPGGATGQALVKFSEDDHDVVWDLPSGSTDTNAMHFRGTWVNNLEYTWGDVVIDSGGLYILNAVDTLTSFQPAPSSESDPETANWLKIASLT